jgi:8-oxo-dGTP diphosphatase
MASLQGDTAAWEAHLAEGNAKQARKRVAADVLVRDASQRILLVDPSYKPAWDLPGGMAEANEPPLEAVRREVREELGLELTAGRLLCVDWVSPHGPWDDTLMFLFDGGTLTAPEISRLRLLDDELTAYQFCTEAEAAHLLRPYVWRRVQAALRALRTGHVCYLQDGQPVEATAEQSSQAR